MSEGEIRPDYAVAKSIETIYGTDNFVALTPLCRKVSNEIDMEVAGVWNTVECLHKDGLMATRYDGYDRRTGNYVTSYALFNWWEEVMEDPDSVRTVMKVYGELPSNQDTFDDFA